MPPNMRRGLTLRDLLATLAVLVFSSFAPDLASAQALRNANGVPYTSLLGCDGLTPASASNPVCASSAVGSLTTTAPVKVAVTGLTVSTNVTNTNLLDGTGAAAMTDVRGFNSALVTVVSTAATGSYTFQGAFNSGATIGLVTLQAQEITNATGASMLNGAITPTAATRVFRVLLADVNYFRINLSTGPTTGAITAYATLTQAAPVPQNVNVQQATGTNLNAVIASGTVTTVSTVTGVTTVSSVTSGNLGIPGAIVDVASAALTTTTTTGAFTPTYGASYEVNIPVTVVTGTTPTLDVDIEESDDTGTNWFKVYSFPRITATGMYRSPKLLLKGNRVRYVQTVAGTTPSFTRAVNRLQASDHVLPFRQLIDRSVVLTTLNSATPSLNVQDTRSAQLVINIGAASTPPALQLEGSDDNGATWYTIGSPLTAVASSTVQVTVANINAGLIRARVSTAGVTVTAGHVLIKGF